MTAFSGTSQSLASAMASRSAVYEWSEPSTPTTTGSPEQTTGSHSGGMTYVGQHALTDTRTLTEPSTLPAIAPRPRVPTTSPAADFDSSISTAAGGPSRNAVEISTLGSIRCAASVAACSRPFE